MSNDFETAPTGTRKALTQKDITIMQLNEELEKFTGYNDDVYWQAQWLISELEELRGKYGNFDPLAIENLDLLLELKRPGRET